MVVFALVGVVIPGLLKGMGCGGSRVKEACFSGGGVSCFLFIVTIFFAILLSFLDAVPSGIDKRTGVCLGINVIVFYLL